MPKLIRPVLWIFGAALAPALLSCSNGTGGAATNATTLQRYVSAEDYGSVILLLTDAESDRFNQILVTLDAVVLIGAATDSQQQGILDEPITVDLRALTNFAEFLAQAQVKPGIYSKVRLIVSQILLNRVDENGNVIEQHPVVIPSGHIDLNPGTPFTVSGGGEQVLMIDFDAANSFKTVATGSGTYRLRPVVLLKVIGDGDDSVPGRLIRQFGNVTHLDLDNSTFDLCSLEMTSAEGTDTPDVADCAAVHFDEATAILTEILAAAESDALTENTGITVIGEAAKGVEGLEIHALVMVLGTGDSLREVKGTTSSGVAADGTFTLVPDADQGFADSLTAALVDQAVIFERRGGALVARDEMTEGMRVTLFGARDGEAADRLSTIAVAIAEHVTSTVAEAEGTVVSMGANGITITTKKGASEVCVDIVPGTAVHILTGTDTGAQIASLASLALGIEVEVHGAMNEDGCLSAETILVDANGEDQQDRR